MHYQLRVLAALQLDRQPTVTPPRNNSDGLIKEPRHGTTNTKHSSGWPGGLIMSNCTLQHWLHARRQPYSPPSSSPSSNDLSRPPNKPPPLPPAGMMLKNVCSMLLRNASKLGSRSRLGW